MVKKALVIVESPSKAKTIQKYLGREYIVKASVGHVKDLPKSKIGVDLKNGFEPDYQIIPTKTKIIAELKKFSKQVSHLYLATDPDREGEAIAWHIQEELKARGKKIHRVLFNAITRPCILQAMQNPQALDEKKYHAQQARRILDRLVGYKISPLLWDKVRRGISAGRVQSVSLRLIVDRESSIKAFKSTEYWKITALFSKDGIDFITTLFKIDEKEPFLPNQEAIDIFLKNIQKLEWKVGEIEQKERSRRPSPPYITSKLQQEAAHKLNFSAKKTMALAQRLYEGLDLGELGTQGLITYMRTDSTRVEPEALQTLRDYIKNHYGAAYLPETPHFYKSKKNSQDAHEAIRPTSLEWTPEKIHPFLEKDEFRLYQLIWNRFIASQMMPAIYDQTAINIISKDANAKEYKFRSTGSVIKFRGFTAVYSDTTEEDSEEKEAILKLPPLKIGDTLIQKEVTPSQHFTLPPPRYTDASLIKDLEENGIGRPSTYASILSNIQDREYVEKRENRYYPSELGTVVTELLVNSFPNILNTEFTAEMENQLDAIEEGKASWKKTLGKFWKTFEKTLEKAKKQMKDVKRQEVATELLCEKCTHTMVIKWGKLGSFLACSNYPECKNTQDFKKDEQGKIVLIPKEFTDKKCKNCENFMIVKNGKFGKFLACTDYPNCKYTQAITLGIKCPSCKIGEIAQKQSQYRKFFYSCNSWPGCNFAIWDKPIQKECPQCHFPILVEKTTKKAGLIHKCCQKECNYFDVIDTSDQKNSSTTQNSSS